MGDGEIQAHEAHGFGTGDGFAKVFGMNVASDVTPVEVEGGKAGVLHGGRGGMFDRVPVNRANTRSGRDGIIHGHVFDVKRSNISAPQEYGRDKKLNRRKRSEEL